MATTDQELLELETQAQAAASTSIPQRRFGSRITPQVQQQFIQRREVGQEALQQIQDYRRQQKEFDIQRQAAEQSQNVYNKVILQFQREREGKKGTILDTAEERALYQQVGRESGEFRRPIIRLQFKDSQAQRRAEIDALIKSGAIASGAKGGIIFKTPTGTKEFFPASTEKGITFFPTTTIPEPRKPISSVTTFKPELKGIEKTEFQLERDLSRLRTKQQRGTALTIPEKFASVGGAFVLPVVGAVAGGKRLIERSPSIIKQSPRFIKQATKKIVSKVTQPSSQTIREVSTLPRKTGEVLRATGKPIGELAKDSPEQFIGRVGFEATSGAIIKATVKGGVSLATRLSPKYVKTTKGVAKAVPSSAGEIDIEFLEKGKVKGKTFAEQAELAGITTDVSTAQRGLFGIFEKEKVIEKPLPTTTSPELERSLFLSPPKVVEDVAFFERKGATLKQLANEPIDTFKGTKKIKRNVLQVRLSRLGIADDSRSFLDKVTDFYTADYTLTRARPQALVFRNIAVESIPKSLKGFAEKARRGDRGARDKFEKAFFKFQLKKTGKAKPFGFATTREPELTIAPLEKIRKIKTIGVTVVSGRRVPIIEAELVKDFSANDISPSLRERVGKESKTRRDDRLSVSRAPLAFNVARSLSPTREGRTERLDRVRLPRLLTLKREIRGAESRIDVMRIEPTQRPSRINLPLTTPSVFRPERTRPSPRSEEHTSELQSQLITPRGERTERPRIPTTERTPKFDKQRRDTEFRKLARVTGLRKFEVQLRRSKQFKTIGFGKTLREASLLGQRVAKRTLGRTFRIRGATGKSSASQLGLDLKVFRTPRGKSKYREAPLTFIERGKYALSTGEEKREIQQARQMRAIMKGGLKL